MAAATADAEGGPKEKSFPTGAPSLLRGTNGGGPAGDLLSGVPELPGRNTDDGGATARTMAAAAADAEDGPKEKSLPTGASSLVRGIDGGGPAGDVLSGVPELPGRHTDDGWATARTMAAATADAEGGPKEKSFPTGAPSLLRGTNGGGPVGDVLSGVPVADTHRSHGISKQSEARCKSNRIESYTVQHRIWARPDPKRYG
jgi:hypothetical protein